MNNTVAEDTKEREMTNEEYREELAKIFRKIENNNVLRLWYKYIKGIEGSD